MNEKYEPKRKKASTGETPIHTICVGAVTASIWRRVSPSGYEYCDFNLARSWRTMSSGNPACSRNFFARNQADLVKVIAAASRWIEEREDTLIGEDQAAA